MEVDTILLPPKPEEPSDSECCGTGCTPCVFDIYKKKFKKWAAECAYIKSGSRDEFSTANDNESSSSSSNSIISPYEYRSYVVTQVNEDCDNCKILQFQKFHIENDKENSSDTFWGQHQFPVKLGQHIVLKLDGKCRQYTVLDVENNGSFRILFKIYAEGLLTPFIDKLIVGAKAEMRGPFGNEFQYNPKKYSNLFMFAAGTGIASFARVIDKVLEDEEDETRLRLFYSCRNEKEIMLSGKLKEWARGWNFTVEYFLSNVQEEAQTKDVHFGMKVHLKKIDKSVIEDLCQSRHKNYNSSLYMICGTKSFEKDVINYLKSCNVLEETIKTF